MTKPDCNYECFVRELAHNVGVDYLTDFRKPGTYCDLKIFPSKESENASEDLGLYKKSQTINPSATLSKSDYLALKQAYLYQDLVPSLTDKQLALDFTRLTRYLCEFEAFFEKDLTDKDCLTRFFVALLHINNLKNLRNLHSSLIQEAEGYWRFEFSTVAILEEEWSLKVVLQKSSLASPVELNLYFWPRDSTGPLNSDHCLTLARGSFGTNALAGAVTYLNQCGIFATLVACAKASKKETGTDLVFKKVSPSYHVLDCSVVPGSTPICLSVGTYTGSNTRLSRRWNCEWYLMDKNEQDYLIQKTLKAGHSLDNLKTTVLSWIMDEATH